MNETTTGKKNTTKVENGGSGIWVKAARSRYGTVAGGGAGGDRSADGGGKRRATLDTKTRSLSMANLNSSREAKKEEEEEVAQQQSPSNGVEEAKEEEEETNATTTPPKKKKQRDRNKARTIIGERGTALQKLKEAEEELKDDEPVREESGRDPEAVERRITMVLRDMCENEAKERIAIVEDDFSVRLTFSDSENEE